MLKKVKLAAHRGYSKVYPENTMAAFRASLELKVTMLETDVRMTADKKLVILHDATLDRTTNMSGTVKDMSCADVLTADAGVKKDIRFEGERIPLLEEFLDLVKDRKDLEFNIEMKDYPAQGYDFALESCDRIIAALKEFKVENRVYINSFSGEILKYIDKKYHHSFRLHGYYPQFILGPDFDKSDYDRLFCVCLFDDIKNPDGSIGHREKRMCDKEEFEWFLSKGIEPWVYYPEDKEEFILPSLQNGAVAITSNDPVTALKILNDNGYGI